MGVNIVMNSKELKMYNLAQIEEIKKYKWIESQRRCCDIDENRAALEWISKYAETFREQWFDFYFKKEKQPYMN